MNIVRRKFNQLSITIKYLIVILLITIPIVFGALFTQSKNDDMDYYGVSYNIVQTLRMRVFLLSNYSQTYHYTYDTSNTGAHYAASSLLVDQSEVLTNQLNTLRYGNETLDIPPPTNEDIINDLDLLITQTNAYTSNIELLLNTPEDEEALEYITTHTLTLDQELYQLAVELENTYANEYEQLSTVNVLIIVIVLIFVGFALLQFRLLKRVEFQAKYDLLTKLFSRSSLYNQIKDYNAENFTVIFIDLHHFKIVNDTYGHNIGDNILKEFAMRLQTNFETKRIYRYGGDEFVILIEGQEKTTSTITDLDSIRGKLLAPFTDKKNRKHRINITMGVACTNIGIALFEEKITFSEDLRYDSKNYRLLPMIYDTKEKTDRRIKLQTSILTALENDQIVAHFQPLHYIDGTLKGFEALARWYLDDEIIPPNVFIPLINQQGLGYELDLKMIELVGRAYPDLRAAKDTVKPIISINLAVDTITNISAEKIIDALQKTKIDAKYIVLEILEDVIIGTQTRVKLGKLSEAGYTIALDDFTTGATSFDYLTLEEFNIVKIDQGVVKQLREKSTNRDVIKDLITMIHTSNKDVIIEGVENCEEIENVVELGVDVIQGYCYSKPLPLSKSISYIQTFDKTKGKSQS